MCPIRGARVNRSNATKRPIRVRELIKVRDLFKEIRYVENCIFAIVQSLRGLIIGIRL